MKEISLEEMKNIELEELKFIDKLCKKYKLTYFLAGGTLLGSIRHKGFIPWDDDIDILMPFDDYMKLIDIMKKDKSKYILLDPYNRKDYYYCFSKLVDSETIMYEDVARPIKDYGIYLDIFPILNLPNDEDERVKYVEEIKGFESKYWMYRCAHHYYDSDTLIKKIVKAVICFPQFIYYRFVDIRDVMLDKLMRYQDKETDWRGYCLTHYGLRDAFPKEVYEGKVLVDFENEKFSAMEKWETYLKSLYGDYMKLPPKEKRVSNHHYKAYYKDK